MRRRSFINSGCLIALLGLGSAMIPSVVAAHTEGVEAADPFTPAALLALRSAADRYAAPRSERTAWREIFKGDRASAPTMMGDHAGMEDHAGHMMHSDSATMQQ